MVPSKQHSVLVQGCEAHSHSNIVFLFLVAQVQHPHQEECSEIRRLASQVGSSDRRLQLHRQEDSLDHQRRLLRQLRVGYLDLLQALHQLRRDYLGRLRQLSQQVEGSLDLPRLLSKPEGCLDQLNLHLSQHQEVYSELLQPLPNHSLEVCLATVPQLLNLEACSDQQRLRRRNQVEDCLAIPHNHHNHLGDYLED